MRRSFSYTSSNRREAKRGSGDWSPGGSGRQPSVLPFSRFPSPRELCFVQLSVEAALL